MFRRIYSLNDNFVILCKFRKILVLFIRIVRKSFQQKHDCSIIVLKSHCKTVKVNIKPIISVCGSSESNDVRGNYSFKLNGCKKNAKGGLNL